MEKKILSPHPVHFSFKKCDKKQIKRKEGTVNEVPKSKFFQKFQYPTKLLVSVSLERHFFFANLQKKEKLFSKFLYEKKYTQKTKQQNKPICIGPFFRVDFLLKFFIKNRVFSSFLFEKEKRINRKFLSFY